MDNSIINDIENYISFLRKVGFNTSVSCFDPAFAPFLPHLITLEVHQPQICSFMKSCDKTKNFCARNKKKLNKSALNEPYYDCCYAGVEEYVVPIVIESKVRVAVNVGGYFGKLKKSEIRSRKYNSICGDGFSECYQQLRSNVPSKDEILNIVKPLEYMFSALYSQCIELDYEYDSSEKMYHRALDFICNNYMNEIDTKAVSKQVNYSTSYLSRVFKERAGMSVACYIRSLRLQKSKQLLSSTDMNITAIATETGFCDANYFSTAFKDFFGESPKSFRKTLISNEKQ